MPSKPKSSRDRVRAHRQRLRAQGLRPIQIWVPDTRAPGFAEEAHRQALAASKSPYAAEDQAFVDAISITLTSFRSEAGRDLDGVRRQRLCR